MDAVSENKSFTINEWRVEPALNRLSRADEVIKIDPQHMKVLELLASRPGEVISQPEIEQLAWSGVIVTANSVYQSIAQLRRALGDDRTNPKYIETIARKGYRLVAEVSVTAETLGDGSASAVDPKGNEGRGRFRSPPHLWLVGSLVAVLSGVAIHFYVFEPADAHDVRATTFLDPEASAKESNHRRVTQLADLALAAASEGRPQQAISHYEHALALQRSVGPQDPYICDFLVQLALLYLWVEDRPRSEALAREALHFAQQLGSELNPRIIDARETLGYILVHVGKFEEAQANLLAAIELARTVYGNSDVRIATSRTSLALLRHYEERHEEAHLLLKGAIPIYVAKHGAQEPGTALVRTMLASTLCALDRCDEAIAEVRDAIRILENNARTDHPYFGTAYQVLADCLLLKGEYAEAEKVAKSAMRVWKDNDEHPWRIARAASAAGEALMRQGSTAEAARYFSYATRVLRADRSIPERSAYAEHQRRIGYWVAAQEGPSRTNIPVLDIESTGALLSTSH